MSKAALACVVAWLIPGGGHMVLNKWKRGIVFFAVLIVLFILGLAQQGMLFGLEPGFFGFLKFFANTAIGIPYFLGKMAGWGSADIRAYGYEYGNTFLYTAGLLNLLLIVDTYDIAVGRKQ
jgi:hypothetical protein